MTDEQDAHGDHEPDEGAHRRLTDPDGIHMREVSRPGGMSVEDAYRVLSGLPRLPVDVPDERTNPHRREES